MKTNKVIRITAIGVTAFIFIFIFGSPAYSAAKEPVKIGFICGVSLAAVSTYTVPLQNGIRLAVDEINKSGGILGRPIELIVRDDEGKIDVGVREMRYLTQQAKVDYIIGGFGTHIVLAESEIAKQQKTPYLPTMGNGNAITEAKGHRYIFQLPPSTRMEGTGLGVYLAKQPFKKIWTVGPDYEFGRTLIGFAVEKLKKLRPDVELVGQSWPKLGEKEMSPYISQILAAKPDVIINVQYGSDLVSFIKQAKPYGLFGNFAFAGLFDQACLVAIGDEMVENVIGCSRGDFFAIKTPEMDAFVKKYREIYKGEYPMAYTIFGYEAVYCAKLAMEKAGSTDKEKVVDALTGMHFSSPRGKLYFRECDNMASGSIYMGRSYKDPRYPFYIFRDVVEIPAKDTWLSCEEIRKLRAK